MKIAILETIATIAGHEIEFDRILVNELKRESNKPFFLVPPNFPFKIDYKTEICHLEGGESISYSGAGRLKKLYLSFIREKRRIAWFNDAFKKEDLYDALIVPIATYRFLKSLLKSKLRFSKKPVYFIFHGINPKEKTAFLKQQKACEKYENIHLRVITLRDDFDGIHLNLKAILPPILPPLEHRKLPNEQPLKLGFFGQFRREKNLGFFLEAFVRAKFKTPCKLMVQGSTNSKKDAEVFEKYTADYKDYSSIEFLHKALLGEEWERALIDIDIVVMPYASQRYLYHWSAMLFTAIGFYKPILISPEINPEVLKNFDIGETLDMSSQKAFIYQLENFVNNFQNNNKTYQKNLILANEKYSHKNFVKSIFSQNL